MKRLRPIARPRGGEKRAANAQIVADGTEDAHGKTTKDAHGKAAKVDTVDPARRKENAKKAAAARWKRFYAD
jgi:hypothetical protein